jgi:hypothetical protein
MIFQNPEKKVEIKMSKKPKNYNSVRKGVKEAFVPEFIEIN